MVSWFKDFKFFVNTVRVNLTGFSTKRKLIVIESDDWGGVRMPNKNVYDRLLKFGIQVDKSPYSRFDTLADSDDLEALFSVLSGFEDHKGNSPVITANVNTHNPDFPAIRNLGFETFISEEFTKTLERYYPNQPVFQLWQEGISKNLFFVQNHHLLHVNPYLWLQLLKQGNKHVMKSFEFESYGLGNVRTPSKNYPYLSSLLYSNPEEEKGIRQSLEKGGDEFSRIFGFTSKSFIAPRYCWAPNLETTFSEMGVEYLQGCNFHRDYDLEKMEFTRYHHVLGKKNSTGQICLFRNVRFEPSIEGGGDALSNCLSGISKAFHFNRPAVICSHRLNFIGRLDEGNRKNNLQLLRQLFKTILKQWPEVEFINTVQLGEIIRDMNTK
jgi:hypothetical protein